MVLAEPVGKKRSFTRGLLLTIATFGVYAIYWNYRAHNEVYRQFELEHERRDEGMVWYVLGLIIPPLLIAYLWTFSSNVDHVRRRIGLARRWTAGRFIATFGVAVGLLTAALVMVAIPNIQFPVELVGSAVLAGLILAGVAYAGLQRDINELWDAWAARVTHLRAQTVAPLPERIDALRMREPRLAALPRLEILMRTDPPAATALAYDLENALDERRRLMALRDAPEARERLELLEAALLSQPPQAGHGDAQRAGHEGGEGGALGEREEGERVDGDGNRERPDGGDEVRPHKEDR